MMEEENSISLPDSVWEDYEYTNIHVAALIADFHNKPAITNALSPFEYNEMINAYQQSMLEMIEELRRQGREIREVYQTGGQLVLLFYSREEVKWNFLLDGPEALEGTARKKLAVKCRKHKEKLALSSLKSAIQIMNHWLIQEFNLKRVRSHKAPWELGIGLHVGRAYLGTRPDGQVRIEGDLLDQAKQINESTALSQQNHILLSHKIHDYISRMVVKHTQIRQRVFFHEHDVSGMSLDRFQANGSIYELKFFHRIGIHVSKEAIDQFSAIFSLNQANLWAYNLLVDYYGFVTHDWKSVYELAKKARLIHPKDEKVLYDLAKCYFETGQFAESKKYAEEALAINDTLDLLHELLFFIAHEMKDIDAQIHHMRESLFLSPNSPINHFNLGLALLDNNQPEEGYYYLNEAIRLYPDFASWQHFRETLANLKSEGKLPELLEYYLEMQDEAEQKRLDEESGKPAESD